MWPQGKLFSYTQVVPTFYCPNFEKVCHMSAEYCKFDKMCYKFVFVSQHTQKCFSIG